MKIGISVATYYPEKNGVQFVTQNLAEGLAKRGHEVTVITSLKEGQGLETKLNGVNVDRCDIRNKNMFHFGNKRDFQNKIINLSKNVDVIVFVCLESVAADWGLDILDNVKCQKILYMHGMHRFKWNMMDFQSPKNNIYKVLRDVRWGIFYKLNEKMIARFDKVIHIHEQDNSYKFFEKKYPGKNYVLENFAEDIFFSQEANEIKEVNYFICISNYYTGKNQELLLKAFYLMKNNFKLLFVGGGDEKYYKKLLSLKNQLDSKYNVNKDIEILYGIDRCLFPDLLKKAYAFVMTSRAEHYPISIIEAMASGIPFISTDVGVVKYLPGGIIVEHDAIAVAKAMDRLIDNEDLYNEKKASAKKYVDDRLKFKLYLNKFEELVLK